MNEVLRSQGGHTEGNNPENPPRIIGVATIGGKVSDSRAGLCGTQKLE